MTYPWLRVAGNPYYINIIYSIIFQHHKISHIQFFSEGPHNRKNTSLFEFTIIFYFTHSCLTRKQQNFQIHPQMNEQNEKGHPPSSNAQLLQTWQQSWTSEFQGVKRFFYGFSNALLSCSMRTQRM